MENLVFWILWLVSGLLLIWPAIRAVYSPREMFSWPFLAGLFGLYFYVYMAYEAATHLVVELPSWTLPLGQFVVVLSYLGFYAGWYRYPALDASEGYSGEDERSWDYRPIWWIGIVLVYAGLAADFTFKHYAQKGFQETAYWYMFPRVAYAGAAVCVIAFVRERTLRTPFHFSLLVIPVVGVSLPEVLAARRGPTMAWLMVFLFGCSLARRKCPSRLLVLTGLLVGGLLVLSFLPSRRYLVQQMPWLEALRNVTYEEVLYHRTRQVPDNEYAYHCAMIATLLETGQYQYGTGHLMLLLHWVPRQWWPAKPGRGEGLLPDAKDEMLYHTGVRMGIGMSYAGVAEAFNQYGFLAPVFWFVLGRIGAGIYRRVLRPDDWFWKATWINVLSCTHWLVAQGLPAFFVPLLFAQLALCMVLLIIRGRRVQFVSNAAAAPGISGAPELVHSHAQP